MNTKAVITTALGFLLVSSLGWANEEMNDAGLTSEQKELQLIAEAAEAAVTQGQWSEAFKRWELALEKVETAGGDKEYRAILNYEHGRAAGVLCRWDKASSSLQKALELDRQTQGPFFTSLLELARLHLAQKAYKPAKKYYDELLPELRARNAPVIDPVGSADILMEYADVLEALGGDAELVEPYRNAAKEWKEKHTGFMAETLRTPYGSRCQ